ncbi:MAG: putative Ig domain-containing protein, partial [Oscillospiraceae bacterium]|nr:putative Ig domain-containing protein [Oscillospiraceae bacterium]
MKYARRLLSLLLVLVMVLGLVPAATAAPAEQSAEAESIRIDLEAFAKEAAKQDWWDDLKVSDTDDVKLIGSKTATDAMTEAEQAAYSAMQAWLAENEVWQIDETRTKLGTVGYAKRLYIDASGSDATGIRFFASAFASQVSDDRAKLVLTIHAEAAGLYNMQLDLLKEAGGYSTLPRIDNIGQGGGYGNIYLNGEQLYADYDFGEREKSGAKNVRETDSFGAVWLQEGENELVIEMTRDYTGNLNNGRRMVNLKGLYFTPLADCVVPVGGGMVLDVYDYLPFDVEVSAETHEAVSEDETIAKVTMNENCRLIVEGVGVGETAVLLQENGETVYSLEVTVTEASASAAEPIIIDLKGFVKRASTQSWWDDLTTVYTASGAELKKVGSDRNVEMTDAEKAAYDAFVAWQEGAQAWVLNGDGTRMDAGLGNRLYLSATDDIAWAVCHNGRYGTTDGASDIAVDVEVDTSGWYALNMELVLQHETGKDTVIDTTANTGGGYADIYVNGECIYKGFKFRADAKSDVVEANFGKVFLNEGINTLTVRAVGHYNGPVFDGYSGRSNINVASMALLPLGGAAMEVGQTIRMSLDAYFCSYGAEYGTITAEAEGAVTAEVFGGDLVLTGVEEGSGTVSVYDDGQLLAALPVTVTEETDIIYNFAKAAEVTADGFENIKDYDDLDVDDVRSAPWRYEVSSGKNYYDADMGAAVLMGDGSYVSFALEAPEGAFLPQLHYMADPSGGKVRVYLDDLYLGTVDTYAPVKRAETAILRPVETAEGAHSLTLELVGRHVNNTGSGILYWNDFVLAEGTAELTLDAGSLSAKVGRPMETTLSGGWDGLRYDDLIGAELRAEVSHGDILTAVVIPATETSPATLQVQASEPVEDATVTVTASINGVIAANVVDVEVLAGSPVISADVSLEGTETGLIPRLTTREIRFDLLCEDGDKALPSEVDVSYEVRGDAVQVDEEAHTLTALADGEADVTVTVSQDSFTYTETFHVTVAAQGENRMPEAMSAFDDASYWSGISTPADDRWLAMELADDGTGNSALKVTVNPNTTYNAGKKEAMLSKNGNLAVLERGQLYEMTFRVKIDSYTRAEGAANEPRLIMQFYDFPTNANGSSAVGEYYKNYVLDYANMEKGVWYELAIPVRGPIEGDGILYGLTRLTYSPHYAAASAGDKDLTGFEGTFWFDDVEIREVGFETVRVEASEDLLKAVRPIPIYARPETTTGNLIMMDTGSIRGNVTYRSGDEDVAAITSGVSVLSEQYAYTEGSNEYASANAQLVGKNDTAKIYAAYTIGDVTREGVLEVEVTGRDDVLREMRLHLNGAESLVLPRGGSAESTVTGITTQLTEIPAAELDSIYFSSSDITVAKVDAVTGKVTCLNEGTATITAYGLLDGKAAKGTALITVNDDTDLQTISIESETHHIGVGGILKLWTEGKKASGGAADMARYPVAWSVDEADAEKAVISEDGYLTGLAAGEVTVTASVTVGDKPITASVVLDVVPDTDLPGGIINFDFTDSASFYILDATLEDNGIEIDRDRTFENGEGLELDQSGMILNSPVGGELALNFMVRKSGWYRVEVRGRALYYRGCLSGFYVDDEYIGQVDFGSDTTSTDKEGGFYNTVWLEAGIHSMVWRAEEARRFMPGRVTFFPAEDPNEVTLTTTTKTELVPGEATELALTLRDRADNSFFLHYETAKPSYTNYFMLESSDPSVLKITRDLFTTTLTALKPGKVTVTVKGEILGKSFTKQVELEVKNGTIISADLTAERTTVAPGAGSFPLTLTANGLSGQMAALPEGVTVTYESGNTEVATVSQSGVVTVNSTLGSALITATIREGDHTVEALCWITVTENKAEPSLYTYEERAIAQENALKYTWAWEQKDAAVRKANYYVENLEHIYNMWPHEGLPRNVRITVNDDPNYKVCPSCNTDLVEAGYGTAYHYQVDPIENPWKVKCPHCKALFPSNDFESFYECGLDERGKFTVERAMANGGEKYLVNELYPEKGEGWGVDDGFGWHPGELDPKGKERIYTFIAYYTDLTMYTVTEKNGPHSMLKIMDALREAYIYSGDEKYGSAGAILVDRLADIYPDYDLSIYRANGYHNGDGSSKRGKIAGSIWECLVIQAMCKAVDAFWPCAENPDVIEFLQKYADRKGVAPEDITPDYLRRNAEDNILLEARSCLERNYANGNFGFEQTAMAMAGVVLDRMPETKAMLDWVFAASKSGGQYTDSYNTGGDLYNVFMSDIDRDGFGNEGSISYNGIWLTNLMDLADTLNGYDKVENADLWKHPKFFNLYTSYIDLTVCGRLSPAIHETSAAFQYVPTYVNINNIMPAFVATGDAKIARTIYAINGNSTDGLHADIFTKDPERGLRSRIQQIVNEEGEWDMSESGMLSGFGMAILREGPQRYLKGVNEHAFSSYWINFSLTSSHTHHEALNLDFEAFGLPMCGNMGYPVIMNGSDPNRNQWNGNTVSNNTVVVDDMCQNANTESGFPKHFADDGYAKVMDIDSPNSYTQTDIYRRTVVTVKADNGVDYAVDFFRVVGGSEHVYSFHGATRKQPTTKDLNMVQQPFGTYAGADIPFGDYDFTGSGHGAINTGSGYSWLWDVYRDEDPGTSFTVDWAIEDYQSQLATSAGIHMSLTMLSEEPMTEVALANGEPAQDGRAPDHVEFMLVRNSGEPGLDTLFTSVIQPYQITAYIESSELVEAKLVDGTEGAVDRVQAVKVTLTSGRVDYIVYATNSDCTYSIDGGKFKFRGFAGVCSYVDGSLTYAWGNEVSMVEDKSEGTVIDAMPAVTGRVLDFTKDLSFRNTMTISMDTPVSEEVLTGQYIYVNNDGLQNGTYRIYGAKVDGSNAVLDLQLQDMIRGYIDPFNMDLGFRYNIAEGQTYSIPLSASYDPMSYFNYTTDQVVRAGNKITLTTGVAGSGVTYEAEGVPNGMKLTAVNGLITWTPSRTQTGRYPITVKAVDAAGTVLGTMSFTIYVVNYSGSSYTPDKCSHAKMITYTLEDTIETVCPACGTITKTPITPECDHTETTTEVKANGDKTHTTTVTCVCGEVISTETADCTDADKDTLCDDCGAAVVTIKKFSIAGSNMTLGNELEVNFLFLKKNLTGTDNVAIV